MGGHRQNRDLFDEVEEVEQKVSLALQALDSISTRVDQILDILAPEAATSISINLGDPAPKP